jgi:L-asparaginase
MTIQFFTTGGSIDKLYSTKVSQFTVGDPSVEFILEDSNITFDFQVTSLIKKDSLEITDEDRNNMVTAIKECPYRQIVVTHGTDSMIQTALSLLDIPEKVIILTGAMQPASFRHTDAYFNIGAAVIAVQVLPPGVYLIMNGRIFEPRNCYKNIQAERFEEIVKTQ